MFKFHEYDIPFFIAFFCKSVAQAISILIMICGLSHIHQSVDIWDSNYDLLFIKGCRKILGLNLKFYFGGDKDAIIWKKNLVKYNSTCCGLPKFCINGNIIMENQISPKYGLNEII